LKHNSGLRGLNADLIINLFVVNCETLHGSHSLTREITLFCELPDFLAHADPLGEGIHSHKVGGLTSHIMWVMTYKANHANVTQTSRQFCIQILILSGYVLN